MTMEAERLLRIKATVWKLIGKDGLPRWDVILYEAPDEVVRWNSKTAEVSTIKL
jgi:hypothetical protein